VSGRSTGVNLELGNIRESKFLFNFQDLEGGLTSVLCLDFVRTGLVEILFLSGI
jgi:hypothetical protein